MRFLLGLMCVAMMVVALGGCDKKETAQESTTPAVVTEAAPAVAVAEKAAPAAPIVEQAVPAEPVAKQAPVVAQPEAAAAPTVVTDPEAVVVTVNGELIKKAAVDAEMNKRIEAMKKRMPAGQEMQEQQKQQLRMSVVDMLVQQMALKQELAKRNVTVSDEKVMDEITKIAKQRGQTLEDVEKEISQYGMTMDDLKSQVRPQAEMQALAEACEKDPAMQAEAKKFYDENPSYFQIPEQVRASHILIKMDKDATEEAKAAAKAKATEILAKAKAGEDFAALAKEYSEDPGSKDNGGEYTFPRGQMVKPFEDAAFSMEPNQISDLVETPFGYHIIKLHEKKPAGVQPFEEAQKQITAYLLQKQMKENAKIEYSKEEQAMRDQVKQQQQMMQQQMQERMAKQKAEQAAKQSAEKAAPAVTEPAKAAPAEEVKEKALEATPAPVAEPAAPAPAAEK